MSDSSKVVWDNDVNEFLEAWSATFADVLTQIGGAPVACNLNSDTPADSSVLTGPDHWIIATVTGRLSGELALRICGAAARRLARFFMGEGNDNETEVSTEYAEALLELLRQVAGHAVTKLKSRWNDVQVNMELGTTPTWAYGNACWFSFQFDPPVAFEVRISAALAPTLRTKQPVADQSINAPDNTPAKLDMLLDVELGVQLRFGSKRMLLRDILDLCSGTVVELDQQLQDPVDLLLDGKVIARGEVVVVDGNYGLRVTQLAGTAAN
jgi:flagellar motor switch protein FliN/FliY